LSKPDRTDPQRRNPDTGEGQTPRLATRLLRGGSALVLIALMVGGGHLLLRLEPEYLPVRVITVDGEVHRLPLTLLQSTVSERLEGGILTQDLGCLKSAIEELAWVHTAAVRRVWPDRLLISIFEHEPMARWGERALVTAAGVVFTPGPAEIPDGLPRLDGADDQAPAVTDRFLAWGPRFEGVGLSLTAMELDARGAWTLYTDAGFAVSLGTGQTEERVRRFLTAYPDIAAAGHPARVDMRYSNGLAVSWMDATALLRRSSVLPHPQHSRSPG
jgi:cell division protein FtsQ